MKFFGQHVLYLVLLMRYRFVYAVHTIALVAFWLFALCAVPVVIFLFLQHYNILLLVDVLETVMGMLDYSLLSSPCEGKVWSMRLLLIAGFLVSLFLSIDVFNILYDIKTEFERKRNQKTLLERIGDWLNEQEKSLEQFSFGPPPFSYEFTIFLMGLFLTSMVMGIYTIFSC